MARFLLIHGAAHGAWCWRDVIPALAARGHGVTAIDLPSHGDDPTSVGDVTLDLYAQAILAAMDGPTILVGHSLAGFAITRAAEIDNRNIARLVYLCAHTPWPGKTLAQMRFLGATQPLEDAIAVSPDGMSHSFVPVLAAQRFYQDCPEEAVAQAPARLCPQARQPGTTVVALTDRSQALPRSYILCRNDCAVPPDLQEKLAARFDTADVHELPTGHSPFLAIPDRLAAPLDRIASS